MVKPRKDPVMSGERLVGSTLSKVYCERVLVQPVKLGISPISLPRHGILVDPYMVSHHCISKAQLRVVICAPLQAAKAS